MLYAEEAKTRKLGIKGVTLLSKDDGYLYWDAPLDCICDMKLPYRTDSVMLEGDWQKVRGHIEKERKRILDRRARSIGKGKHLATLHADGRIEW